MTWQADLPPQERALRARLAAYAQHAKHDTRETTKRARQAAQDRFLHEVDPNLELPEMERRRRAEAARRAFYTRIALKSAEVRGKKNKARQQRQGTR